MNKTIVIEKKNGKRESYVVRQAAHDKPMVVGGKLFGGVTDKKSVTYCKGEAPEAIEQPETASVVRDVREEVSAPADNREIFSTAWGIMFGCMDRNGRRIIPGRGDRKRMEIRFGINPSLSNWRRWVAEDPAPTPEVRG